MHPEYGEIIANIREIIKEKGLKQKIVAQRSGIPETTFSHMMTMNRCRLRVEHIPRIAAALEVNIGDLFKTNKIDQEVTQQ